MTNEEYQIISPYIETGWGFNVGCSQAKITKSNVVNVDKENPHADCISDFRESGVDGYLSNGLADFIVMTRFLGECECPVQFVRRAWNLLKPGGRFLITEPLKDTHNRQWQAPPEMEGFMSLFKEFFFRENLSGTNDSYTLVYQKRRPVCLQSTSEKQEKK